MQLMLALATGRNWGQKADVANVKVPKMAADHMRLAPKESQIGWHKMPKFTAEIKLFTD